MKEILLIIVGLYSVVVSFFGAYHLMFNVYDVKPFESADYLLALFIALILLTLVGKAKYEERS